MYIDYCNSLYTKPNNLPFVNHKDENKENNNVNNLEWCNSSYNCIYSRNMDKANMRRKNSFTIRFRRKCNKKI